MKTEEDFEKMLDHLAQSNGGSLPLSHESPAAEAKEILKTGKIETGDDSVFFSLGHIGASSFVQHGKGVIIHLDLPRDAMRKANVHPDMKYGMEGDQWDKFLLEHPDGKGGYVSIMLEPPTFPSKWWKSVYDNKTREQLWP